MRVFVLRSALLLGVTSLSSEAFFLPPTTTSPARIASSVEIRRQLSSSLAVDVDKSSDFGTAVPPAESAYDRLGVPEENLALGINAEEVLKYIGTRESLIEKAMKDIPKFNREKAEAEVDKFLLDYEVLKIYIEFEKRKAEDPDFEVPKEAEEEGFFSIRTVVYGYLGYVVVGAGGKVLREWVQEKAAAGEWSGTGIQPLDDWLAQTPAVDVDAATDVIQSAADVATDVLP